jgi:hypothetical protein
VWVIPALEELEYGCLCLGFGAKGIALELLALECREETLAHRVVIAVTHRAHRRFDSSHLATRSEGHRGVLRALVGVVDDSVRSACCERHIQSAQYQLGQQVRAHGPAHYLAAEYIEHHGEVQESLPSGEWSERPGVVELSPDLSSPNRTCTFQRIRLSI